MQKLIPTYRANGRRVSDSTPERVARLLKEGKVAASYTRHGRMRSIQFVQDGDTPVHKRAHQGQQYAYCQPLPSGHHAWKHREMLGRGDIEALFGELTPAELEKRDLFLQAVFRAVPLSVMPSKGPSPQPAPGHSRGGQHRPVEFDSEMRLGA